VSWARPTSTPPPTRSPRFRPLLDSLDLTATIVTADAPHTQREHADWLVTSKHAAYLLIVKANQPSLHHQLRRLP
jgi:predicted transposase YbfD/YdcC